jgi:hypothetical protein
MGKLCNNLYEKYKMLVNYTMVKRVYESYFLDQNSALQFAGKLSQYFETFSLQDYLFVFYFPFNKTYMKNPPILLSSAMLQHLKGSRLKCICISNKFISISLVLNSSTIKLALKPYIFYFNIFPTCTSRFSCSHSCFVFGNTNL